MHNETMTDIPAGSNVDRKSAALHKRLHHKRHIVKSFKAEADMRRSMSERIADFMTIRLGSMTFLTLNSLFFTFWIAANIGLLPNILPFDSFPFGFLTLVVSLEAIFLAVIVLISQNREAKIADLREEIALQIDSIAEEEITKVIELQIMLLKKQGIDVSNDKEIQDMLQSTSLAQIEKALQKQGGKL